MQTKCTIPETGAYQKDLEYKRKQDIVPIVNADVTSLTQLDGALESTYGNHYSVLFSVPLRLLRQTKHGDFDATTSIP